MIQKHQKDKFRKSKEFVCIKKHGWKLIYKKLKMKKVSFTLAFLQKAVIYLLQIINILIQ